MALTVAAIYENGQLRLLEATHLDEGQLVLVTIETEDEVWERVMDPTKPLPDMSSGNDAYLEVIRERLAREFSGDKPLSDYIIEERDER
jgi:predicted DNA-binding antitoxin AbrB/MazE fold protein